MNVFPSSLNDIACRHLQLRGTADHLPVESIDCYLLPFENK